MQKIPTEVHTVMETLAAAGEKAYLVGGCVREALRGAAPSDYDMTTSARPERVMALFGAAAHPTGLKHGTVTVAADGRAVEITTMRRDGVYKDNRHPESVAFTDCIEEDLARRDFTVNAIAMTEDGALIDPYGGRQDIEKCVLRCVGDPKTRFEEDALRILRLLRFSAVLGFAMEAETAAAAHECRELLKNVARERIYAELNKLLCGAFVTPVLLSCPDILGVVIPEILPSVGFDQHNFHHCFDVWGHTAYSVGAVENTRVLRWTMLFHDLGKPCCMTFDEDGVGHFYGHTGISAQIAGGIMERLHFEAALRAAVRAQLNCFDDMFAPERAAVHREMARRGREVTGNLICTKMADNAAKAPAGLVRAQAPWEKTRKIYAALCMEGACCTVSELAVSGRDMMALGFSGREVGMALRKLLDEAAAEKLPNTREALMTRAVRLRRSGYGRHRME